MDNLRKPRSVFLPIVLVTIGVFLLLMNLGKLEGSAWDIFVTYWPILLMIMGLDGLVKRDGWVGPLVLFGLGSILLLGNLHYLPVDAFSMLVRFWPVLLVAIGLDIAFGHKRSGLNTMLRILAGLAIVIIIAWAALALPSGQGVKRLNFTEPLNGITSAVVRVDQKAGDLRISGGASTAELVNVSIEVPANAVVEPVLTKDTNGKATYRISEGDGNYLPLYRSSSPWLIQLNPAVPAELQVQLAAGNLELDLRETQVDTLTAELAAGNLEIHLPCDDDFQSSLDAAVGNVTIYIPKGCNLRVNYSGGLSGVSFPDGYLKTENQIVNRQVTAGGGQVLLNIEVAVGHLSITEED